MAPKVGEERREGDLMQSRGGEEGERVPS